MRRYRGLWERLVSRENVERAVREAARGKRGRAHVERCLSDVAGTAGRVIALIESGFVPSEPSEVDVWDESRGKQRHICCPRFFPDQIMHHVVIQVLAPCVLRGMSARCMACVPGRGQHAAARLVARWLEEDPRGTRYAAKMDVRHFYQEVDRDLLMERLRRLVKDERFVSVVGAIVMGAPGTGLPIGFYTSQWLANLYLQDVDHIVEERVPAARHYVRYMDDMLMLGPNKRALRRAVGEVSRALSAIGLSLKRDWQVFRVTDANPVPFVGFTMRRGYMRVRPRTHLRAARQVRRAGRAARPSPVRARRVLAAVALHDQACGESFRQRVVYPNVSLRQIRRIVAEDDASRRA